MGRTPGSDRESVGENMTAPLAASRKEWDRLRKYLANDPELNDVLTRYVERLFARAEAAERERDGVTADLIRQVESQRRENGRLEALLDNAGVANDGGGTIGALTEYERIAAVLRERDALRARVAALEAGLREVDALLVKHWSGQQDFTEHSAHTYTGQAALLIRA